MSAKLTHSDKLLDLWNRICEKSNVYEAERAFGNRCSRRIHHVAMSALELLEEGSNLRGNYFVYQDDNFIYLFNYPTVAATYNAILRNWCENTGRKTKKKGT